MKKLTIAFMCLWLMACAEHVAERRGTEIQVVPITYSIDVQIKKNKEKKAWQELDSYVQKHWNMIATQTVSLYWKSKAGKTLADKYSKYLLSQGVDSHKLIILEATDESGLQFEQDLRLESVVNRVVVDTCEYEVIGNFGAQVNGCFVENARWQSMVNPEKMLRTE